MVGKLPEPRLGAAAAPRSGGSRRRSSIRWAHSSRSTGQRASASAWRRYQSRSARALRRGSSGCPAGGVVPIGRNLAPLPGGSVTFHRLSRAGDGPCRWSPSGWGAWDAGSGAGNAPSSRLRPLRRAIATGRDLGTKERGDPACRGVRRGGHLLRGHPDPGRGPRRVLDPDVPHLPRRDQGRPLHVPGADGRREDLQPRQARGPARLLQPGGLGPPLGLARPRGRDPLRRHRRRDPRRLPAARPPGPDGEARQGDRRLAARQEHGRGGGRVGRDLVRHHPDRGAGAAPLRPQAGRRRREHRRAARRPRRGRRPDRLARDRRPGRGRGGPRPRCRATRRSPSARSRPG